MRNSMSGKGKRGFSSVVGSVFMVLIMSVLASSYFVYTLSQNTAYNTAVGQKNQLDQSVRSENLQCLNTTYTPFNNTNVVNVKAEIRNIGSTSVQFITFWVCVTNSTPWTGYNFYNLINVTVQPGSVYSLNNSQGINLTISGLVTKYGYSYASWLVTSKGNTVALQTLTTSSNNIITSMTTQGIGALMMDFQNFTYYKVSSTGGWHLDLSSGINAYIPKISDAPFAFSVKFTDLDMLERDIILNANSELFTIFPSTGGNYKAATWYVVNVNPTTGALSAPFASQTLKFLNVTTVYFASITPVDYSSFNSNSFVKSTDMFPGTCPINLALVGTIGGVPFGQNIPFVSALVSP